MSDYLSSVLDELVPTFADEAGDWDASSPTPVPRLPRRPRTRGPRPRRLRSARGETGRWPARWLTPRRLVAIAVTAVLAALLVTPAFGIGDRLLSLIQGKPIPLDVQAPAWSHDGRTIVFVSWRDGNGEVYTMDADGSRLGTSRRTRRRTPALPGRPTAAGSPS